MRRELYFKQKRRMRHYSKRRRRILCVGTLLDLELYINYTNIRAKWKKQ
jgi:hypothetical protein